MNNLIIPGFDELVDETLKVNIEKASDESEALIVNLSGYLDTYNSNGFQNRMAKVIEAGFTKLVFNCKDLNYVSSTGIGSFTAFLKSVKPRGGNIALSSVQPKVYEVFHLLGFTQFFTIKDNLKDAVAFFKKTDTDLKVDGFPLIFTCPICSMKMKAPKAGRFRCSECKSISQVEVTGEVRLL